MPLDHHFHYLYTNKPVTVTDHPIHSNIFRRILASLQFYNNTTQTEIIPTRRPKQVLAGIQIDGEDIRQVVMKIGDQIIHQIDVPKGTTTIPRYLPGFEIPFAYFGDECKLPIFISVKKRYGASVRVQEYWREMTPDEKERVEWIVQGKDEYMDRFLCCGDTKTISISSGLVLLE